MPIVGNCGFGHLRLRLFVAKGGDASLIKIFFLLGGQMVPFLYFYGAIVW